MYVRSKDAVRGGKRFLKSILKCRVVQYTCVGRAPSAAFKVRIEKSVLHDALVAGRAAGCFVDLWRQSRAGHRVASNAGGEVESMGTDGVKMAAGGAECGSVKMTGWNCRGLRNSIPYLNALIEDSSKVFVLSEHWLWPFELHRLGEVHPDFSEVGRADSRLGEESNLSRGCGGVGILWHKSLDATPIEGIRSDRICGIRFREREGSDTWVSVVGVYLPCVNMSLEFYREQLTELERVIVESKVLGPVVVMGISTLILGL